MNYFTDMTEREIEIARKIRRENIKEIAGAVFCSAAFVLLAWAFLVLTPAQMSAEYDLAAEQIAASAN